MIKRFAMFVITGMAVLFIAFVLALVMTLLHYSVTGNAL